MIAKWLPVHCSAWLGESAGSLPPATPAQLWIEAAGCDVTDAGPRRRALTHAFHRHRGAGRTLVTTYWQPGEHGDFLPLSHPPFPRLGQLPSIIMSGIYQFEVVGSIWNTLNHSKEENIAVSESWQLNPLSSVTVREPRD